MIKWMYRKFDNTVEWMKIMIMMMMMIPVYILSVDCWLYWNQIIKDTHPTLQGIEIHWNKFYRWKKNIHSFQISIRLANDDENYLKCFFGFRFVVFVAIFKLTPNKTKNHFNVSILHYRIFSFHGYIDFGGWPVCIEWFSSYSWWSCWWWWIEFNSVEKKYLEVHCIGIIIIGNNFQSISFHGINGSNV